VHHMLKWVSLMSLRLLCTEYMKWIHSDRSCLPVKYFD
jgi:hypothetical protein